MDVATGLAAAESSVCSKSGILLPHEFFMPPPTGDLLLPASFGGFIPQVAVSERLAFQHATAVRNEPIAAGLHGIAARCSRHTKRPVETDHPWRHAQPKREFAKGLDGVGYRRRSFSWHGWPFRRM
jgi:hypothetical protein